MAQFTKDTQELEKKNLSPQSLEYEYDGITEDGKSVFRVWRGLQLLGTLHYTSNYWLTRSFYKYGRYVGKAKDTTKLCDSIREAQTYIINSYERS